MKLWLDDIRTPPEGYLWAKDVRTAIQIVEATLHTGLEWERASLDHDLGELHEVGDGTMFVLWMAEHDLWPTEKPNVHSANPVGRDRMRGYIDRYFKEKT